MPINLLKSRQNLAREVAKNLLLIKSWLQPQFVAGAVGQRRTDTAIPSFPDVNDPGYRAVTFDQLLQRRSGGPR